MIYIHGNNRMKGFLIHEQHNVKNEHKLFNFSLPSSLTITHWSEPFYKEKQLSLTLIAFGTLRENKGFVNYTLGLQNNQREVFIQVSKTETLAFHSASLQFHQNFEIWLQCNSAFW